MTLHCFNKTEINSLQIEIENELQQISWKQTEKPLIACTHAVDEQLKHNGDIGRNEFTLEKCWNK